ncbi:GAF domain-containing protein [Caulobacter sp. UNC279MFTsu5.1]|nr:GAF domain-containing protein [Caulobacter sp. UNC279MFTsu5.1]SFK04107.1 GAF domain-containing protein [Caulobacter sp. UNC279MFTsu5.1]
MSGPRRSSHGDHVLAVVSDRSAAARSALAASWVRSSTWYGLDPENTGAPRTLGANELRQARERIEPLLHAAQANLDRLFLAVGSTGCCVLFTDHHGVPVDRRGVDSDDDTFHRWGLWTGSVWSEEAEGTNGIGTCLAEERPLTIHRDQHFHARNTALSCTVAPIYDHQGRLAAALDVSSCRADLTEGFVGLIAAAVADAARRIEAENFRRAFPKARVLFAGDPERGGGLLAVDRDDLVVGATRAARLAYGLTDARLAQPLPADTLLFPDEDRGEDLGELERSGLQRALARTSGNVSAAAKALGISRATLHRKLARLGLHRRA